MCPLRLSFCDYKWALLFGDKTLSPYFNPWVDLNVIFCTVQVFTVANNKTGVDFFPTPQEKKQLDSLKPIGSQL